MLPLQRVCQTAIVAYKVFDSLRSLATAQFAAAFSLALNDFSY